MGVLDGKEISRKIRRSIKGSVSQFFEKTGIRPLLAAIIYGNNPSSEIYIKKKIEACEEVGIKTCVFRDDQGNLKNLLDCLNLRTQVNAILVQLPLPEPYIPHQVFDWIDPLKDVDGFNPENVGLLVQGRPRFHPCTPRGIHRMFEEENIVIAGKKVVIINRSDIVGKPLSSMLIQDNGDYANATVTVCHDRTPFQTLKEITLQSDIVVVAVGKPKFITADMIKEGSVVVDVGITRVGNSVVGDVDFDEVVKVASLVTPVPGGVGPMTVTMLLENTLEAAKLQYSKGIL